MRIYCPKCTSKHIAQALVLINESKLGYPLHKWLAIGHLAEAEAEIEMKQIKFAREIREIRIEIELTGDSERLLGLLIKATKLISKDPKDCTYWR